MRNYRSYTKGNARSSVTSVYSSQNHLRIEIATKILNFFCFWFSSRRFVEGLPDKGEKLKQFIAQLDIELKIRDVHKKLCTDMLALNIGSDQLDTFEWTGKHVTAVRKNSRTDVMGDDEEVLKMFASHSGVNPDKIIIEYLS